MSYNKSQLQKEYKKVFNSSQRKNSDDIKRSSLSLNNRLVWIHGKPNTSIHNNISSNGREINHSSKQSTKYDKDITDNLNHNLLQAKKTYTVINITFDGFSQEKIQITDQPQKKINKKINECDLKKKKNNNDDCSMTLKKEQDIISLTDPHVKLLDNCSLTDNIKDVIQKEKDDEFDIVFLNDQHQLEIQTINI
ncbi:uncharacterized protein LOC114122398 [Aphis gossypii]|uniref:uncharacterized protein LOC114122398 n=1 Tax=Aphis gossypii TaxID=80765 RepID=UPI002158FA34|nr:uncharacterized protein LOC114122398 [Aphis gossypii]